MSTTTTTTSAADIAAALRHMCRRDCRDEPTPGQMHRLLYLVQGHHLGWFGKPLFGDRAVIGDTGVLVAGLRGKELGGEPGYGNLTNGELNTVGYVLSRYGSLSLHDLDLLTRHSQPAVEAGRGRPKGTAATVRHDAMADYFAHVVDVDPDTRMVDAEWMAGFLERSREQAAKTAGQPGKPDDMGKLRELAASLRAKADARSA